MIFMTAERDDLHDSRAIADTIRYMRLVIIQQNVPHIYHTHINICMPHGGINSRVTVAPQAKLALWRMNVYWQTAIQVHV